MNTFNFNIPNREREDEILEAVSTIFNRSKGQTKLLYNLLNEDYLKLIELEIKMKRNLIYKCPNSEEEIKIIFNLNI